MADSIDDEQFRTILHIRMDSDIRRRLDAFCETTYRSRTRAVNMLLNEALTTHESPD
jgi:predicted transcriptional regulator